MTAMDHVCFPGTSAVGQGRQDVLMASASACMKGVQAYYILRPLIPEPSATFHVQTLYTYRRKLRVPRLMMKTEATDCRK